MAFLEVRNLQKRFGASEVLKHVSFSMEKGTILTILGNSGSGKTTLLRCLNGLETPDGGEILVNDVPQSGSTAVRSFGLVFQNFNLFPQYTALKNVTLAPLLAAKSGLDSRTPAQITQEAQTLLAQVGLREKSCNYPHQLSGGQQQRVAIARALAMRPDILCFDEPTSALDPALTGEVLRTLLALRDAGRTMIVVTHEMRFAERVSDHIVFLADGEVVEEGTPQALFSAPKHPLTRAFLAEA